MLLGNLKDGVLGSDIQQTVDFILSSIRTGQFDSLPVGKHIVEEGRVELLVQEYETVRECDVFFEKHERSAELIYIASGSEAVYWCSTSSLTVPVTEYEESKDRTFFSNPNEITKLVLNAGSYIVVYPTDGHKTRCHAFGKPVHVKKYLAKMWF